MVFNRKLLTEKSQSKVTVLQVWVTEKLVNFSTVHWLNHFRAVVDTSKNFGFSVHGCAAFAKHFELDGNKNSNRKTTKTSTSSKFRTIRKCFIHYY